jgi:hypothetical protein
MATDKKKKNNPKPKAPQDRKRKEPKKSRVEDTLGFNLLKPFAEVPVWDQTPLLKIIYKLQGEAKEGDDVEVDMDDETMIDLVGELGRALTPIAINIDDYVKFASGPNAAQKVMELAMAWASALGEAKSSGAS